MDDRIVYAGSVANSRGGPRLDLEVGDRNGELWLTLRDGSQAMACVLDRDQAKLIARALAVVVR